MFSGRAVIRNWRVLDESSRESLWHMRGAKCLCRSSWYSETLLLTSVSMHVKFVMSRQAIVDIYMYILCLLKSDIVNTCDGKSLCLGCPWNCEAYFTRQICVFSMRCQLGRIINDAFRLWCIDGNYIKNCARFLPFGICCLLFAFAWAARRIRTCVWQIAAAHQLHKKVFSWLPRTLEYCPHFYHPCVPIIALHRFIHR